MAIPTVVNVGAVAAATTAITPGMPVSVLAGDILLLFIETAAQAITVSGGTETWAQVTGSPVNMNATLAADDTRLTVFWARASQNTPTSPTTSDSGNHQLGRIIAFRGCIATGNPWDVTSSPGNTENVPTDTSGSITGVTTTVIDCLIVAAIATALPDATSTTNFSAWTNANLAAPAITEQVDNTTASGAGGGIGVAVGGKAAIGATGNTTVTLGTASTKAMLTIALKPPVGITQNIDGVAAGVSATTGNVAVSRGLQTVPAGVSSVTGATVVFRGLQATPAGVTTLVATDLAVSHPLQAVSAGAGALATEVAQPGVTAALAGVTAGMSALLTPELPVTRALTGTGTGAGAVTGNLTVQGPEVTLEGVTAGVGSLAGALAVTHPLLALAAAAATVAGALGVTHPLAGVTAGTVVVSGDAGRLIFLVGTTNVSKTSLRRITYF